MKKQEIQLEVFISQAENIAREWVIASVEGKETHPKFTDEISMICNLAERVLNSEDDKVNEA